MAADPDAFASWKTNYDRSRATVTRTDYEVRHSRACVGRSHCFHLCRDFHHVCLQVDFADALTRAAKLGATFDKDAYLFPLKFQAQRL